MMLLVEFFSEPFWYRLGLTLAHFLWQGGIAAILIGAVVGLLKVERGNARYTAYLLAFAAMTACPVITFIVLNASASGGSLIPIVVRGEGVSPLSPEAVPTSNKGKMPSPRGAGTTPGATSRCAPVDSVSVRRTISNYVYMSIPSALAAWSIGVLVLSVRLLLGLIGVFHWRRNLEPLPAALAARVGSLCERMGMPEFSRVFVSPSAIQAMAVGYLRPMILLPAALVTQMQPEMLEAVIAHELAHIRRFDLWVNLLQRVVETLLFFHPAVWWLSHRIQAERELCCDELAVKATGEPIVYAAALESATLAAFALRPPALAAGFGSDKKPTLSRVRHVLGLAPSRPSVRFWLAGIVTITFLLALGAAFVLIWHTGTERSIAVLASGESDPGQNIADRFEVKFDRAKWATVTTSTRTAQEWREQEKERLRLYTDVNILNPDRVLGISMQGAITQFETSDGKIIDVADRAWAGPYMAPRYNRRFVRPQQPAKWKKAVRSALRLPPHKMPMPRWFFELDESHVTLHLDSGSLGPDAEKLNRVKGYLFVLMAESVVHIDIPFEPSKKWVRLTDDLEVKVLEAKSDDSRYEYNIETRKAEGAFSKGTIRPGSDLPGRLVTNRQIIGNDGEPIRRNRSMLLTLSMGPSWRGGGRNTGTIEKIRFVIAVNPTHCKVPFELENIAIPGREAAGDGAPKPRPARRGRSANRPRSALRPHVRSSTGILPVKDDRLHGQARPRRKASPRESQSRGDGRATHGQDAHATTRRLRTHALRPGNGAIIRNEWANLSWKPVADATSYNVYLGDCFEDVNNAAADTFQGNRQGTHLIVGFHGFPYPEGLVPGTTYYWRVDPVSKADPNNPRKGDIRSFSIPPRKARDPVPADGAESVDSNAELSWTAGLDAKLHWVYFGDDRDIVAGATGGRPQPRSTFTPPALVPGTTYYWRVDEFDPPNTHTGEVWSFTVKGGAE